MFWFKVTVWENLLESNSVLRDLKIKIFNGVLGLNGSDDQINNILQVW